MDQVIMALKTNYTMVDFVSPYDVSTDEQLDKIDEILDRNVNQQAKATKKVEVVVGSYDQGQVDAGNVKYILECLGRDLPELVDVNLEGKGINNDQCEKICVAVGKSSFVQSLNLKDNKFDDSVGKYISDMIKNNKSLRYLNLEGNSLKKSFDQIIGALDHNKQIVDFPLRGAKFQNDKIEFFLTRNGCSSPAPVSTGGREEKLVTSKVVSGDIDYIVSCLSSNHSELKSLDLSKKNLDNASMIKIANASCGNTNIKKMNFMNNSLSGGCVSAICDMIKNTHLDKLSLEGNQFTQSDVNILIDSVEPNQTLLVFGLDDDKVDYDAMVKLEDCIERNEKNAKSKAPVLHAIVSKTKPVEKKAEPVKVEVTKVTPKKEEPKVIEKPKTPEPVKSPRKPDPVEVIAKVDPREQEMIDLITKIESNDSFLGEVILAKKNLKDSEGIKVVKALESNTHVVKLDLQDNPLTDPFFIALSDLIKKNNTLETIDLDNIKISSKSIDVLIRAVESNRVIIDLVIFEDNASDEQLDALYDLLDRNAGVETPVPKKPDPIPVEVRKVVSEPKQLTKVVEEPKKVETLPFDLQRVKSADMDYITARIKENHPQLIDIPLADKPLKTSSARTMLEALKTNTVVKNLVISQTSLDGAIITPLCDIIIYNSTIQIIDVDFIPFSSSQVDDILNALEKNTTIVDFVVDVDAASEEQLDRLDSLLDRNAKKAVVTQKPLHRLSVAPVRRQSIVPVQTAPVVFEKPKEVVIEKPKPIVVEKPIEKPVENVVSEYDPKRVKSGDVSYIIELATKNHEKLVDVELEGTSLTLDLAVKLFNSLKSNTHCTTLNVMNCELDDECVPALADLISANRHIDDLQIDGNDFAEESYDILLNALEKNTVILCLVMGEDDCNEDQQERMEKYIDRNEKIVLEAKRKEKELKKVESMRNPEPVVEQTKELEVKKFVFNLPPAVEKARKERLEKRSKRIPKKLSVSDREKLRQARLARLVETEVAVEHVPQERTAPVNRNERRQSRIVLLGSAPVLQEAKPVEQPKAVEKVAPKVEAVVVKEEPTPQPQDRRERRQSRLSVVGNRAPIFDETKVEPEPVLPDPETRRRSKSRVERVEERAVEKVIPPIKKEPVKLVLKKEEVKPVIPTLEFDPEVQKILNEMKEQTNPTDYLALEYVNNGSKLKVYEEGSGGFSEINGIIASEGDQLLIYFIWRVFAHSKLGTAKPSAKFAIVCWEGRGASSSLKGYVENHMDQVKKFVSGTFPVSVQKRITSNADFSIAKIWPTYVVIDFKKMEEMCKPEPVKVEEKKVRSQTLAPTVSRPMISQQPTIAKSLTSVQSDVDLTAFRGKKEMKPWITELVEGKTEWIKINWGGKKSNALEYMAKGEFFIEDEAEDIIGGPFLFIFKYKKEFYMLVWFGEDTPSERKAKITGILEPVQVFFEKSMKIKKLIIATKFEEIEKAIQ